MTPRSHTTVHAEPRRIINAMLVLTFTTGIVDAVGYLGLDRVFTANMTGNIVILGMALTRTTTLPIIGPTIALLGFALGAAAAGLVLRSAPGGWSTPTAVLFGLSGALDLGTGVAGTVSVPVRDTMWAYVLTGLIAAAMGVQAGAARRTAVADVTTVVVTSTLVGLAFEAGRGGANPTRWPRRLIAIVAFLLGAGCGALLLQLRFGDGLIVAGALVIVVVGLTDAADRHRRAATSTDAVSPA